MREFSETSRDATAGPVQAGAEILSFPGVAGAARDAPESAADRLNGPTAGRLAAVFAILFLGILAATAYSAYRLAAVERSAARRGAENAAAATARLAAEFASRTVGQADAVLADLARSTESRALSHNGESRHLFQQLSSRQEALPQAIALFAADDSARIVAHSREFPVRETSLRNAEWFLYHAQGKEPPGHVGTAIRGPVGEALGITVSRRIVRADASFAGVVGASLDPAYFERAFREMAGAPGTVIELVHASGRFLARHPADDAALARDPSGLLPFQEAYRQSAAGAQSPGEGQEGPRDIVAFRRVPGFPLIVVVSTPVAAAFAPAREMEAWIWLTAGLCVLSIGLALALLHARVRRRFEENVSVQGDRESLERRVRERTSALEQVNEQLASFSYSISHDLRAPLRAINGFCQALEEDYAEKLDATGRDYLLRVRRASERMGEFIDRIVDLTTVSRSAVYRSDVDLSAMAREVLDELARRDPDRRVGADISPNVSAHADFKLVRLLIAQLLDNAWKFTRGTRDARISFGVTREGNETAYFVDDNGTGFDMAFVSKLFTPFQRLHASSEFEGSGIGLATVKRIVELHGGRVWLDAVPGQGVTVYFTLGEPRIRDSVGGKDGRPGSPQP